MSRMGTQDPDFELVEAARRKDERAMQKLYHRHSSAIYAYALRFTRNEGLAEDVTQETFVRAFRALTRFEGRSRFRTWLFSIAVNQARTAAKKKLSFEDLDEVALTTETKTDTPWLKRRLSQALGKLPEGYREVVVMHDVLGMGHEEIASARSCSVGTSKSQLHKARAKLRELLGGLDV